LIVRGAREHNLKNVSVTIPRDKLTVITGLSGSGKSSLAFDTIYAEGQRRYVESLSAYARQFLGLMEKPDVDVIEGLSPAISIEQKNTGNNPRSTVGTVTEIHDYLRLLYARAGTPHCPTAAARASGRAPRRSPRRVLAWPEGTRLEVRARSCRGARASSATCSRTRASRASCARSSTGSSIELAEPAEARQAEEPQHLGRVDRLVVRADDRGRLTDSLETALRLADGLVEVLAYLTPNTAISRTPARSSASSASS
jgi:excinuclease ABC subunit A